MDLKLQNGGLKSSGEAGNGNAEVTDILEWLNAMLLDLNLPLIATEDDIRARLQDGSVLCQILNKLRPGSVDMDGDSEHQSTDAMRFLSAVDSMGLPGFDVSALEQGSVEEVLQCLQTLRMFLNINGIDGEPQRSHARKRWNLVEGESLDGEHIQVDDQQTTRFGSQRPRNSWDSKFRTIIHHNETSSMIEPRNKFAEAFDAKKGSPCDLSAANASDLMKLNNLDKAPTQTLFSMVNKILDEIFERKNGDLPHRVTCLLRKLVREIERRFSSRADKIRQHNSLAKSRELKYLSTARALQTLAAGTADENEVVLNQLQQIRSERTKLEDKRKRNEHDAVRLTREIEQREAEIINLRQGMEEAKTSYERHCSELENQLKETKSELQKKVQDLECLLTDSKSKMKEIETHSEIKIQKLKKKEIRYQRFIDSLFNELQGLRVDLDSVRCEVIRTQKCYPVEVQNLGVNLKELVETAECYHMVLDENRRLYNEVQDLKGNIRVYCRIRPFLTGQSSKQTTIEHIGENGELVITNPMKPGKDSRRLFKFNKVFAQKASQEEVFKDTQPLIRSVLDGYNVCIFAYGQTGSGKTYTMSGPELSSQKDWGVNYRALHDLFQISQSRRTSILYEVGVQMVEIYNEQVRDLLGTDGPQKRLGIWSTSQPNGLAVPEASMYPVKSTDDVLDLMNIGLMNRAVGATALNERSSRSHSILTVHVRGTDLKSNSVMRGSLHLVDLAGSERVDRSEATGERLREAQHINKSLSALGDVIFALAQKNGHVPYRNSKLTQVLQSSLGGQAKTLMFVQLNPDLESYSETISTLKFAERVSGVELGAARSNKEGRDVREFMEQITSLKDTIAKKDEELERLRLIKANEINMQKRVIKGGPSPSSPRRNSIGAASRQLQPSSGARTSQRASRCTSDQENCSEYSDRHSESGSQHSGEEARLQKEFFHHLEVASPGIGEDANDDVELLGLRDADSEERLSDISDSGLSMGTETDGSMSSVVEYTLFPDISTPAENTEKKPSFPSKLPKPPIKQVPMGSSHSAVTKPVSKVVSSSRKVPAVSSSDKPKPKPAKRWQ